MRTCKTIRLGRRGFRLELEPRNPSWNYGGFNFEYLTNVGYVSLGWFFGGVSGELSYMWRMEDD